MLEKVQYSLLLVIVNVKQLSSGLSPRFMFDSNGGVIGSSESNDWLLKDNKNSVALEHCEIVFIDNSFCLKDLSGKTFINGSEMPLGRSNLAKLKHKDEVNIGSYNIRILFDASDDLTDMHSSLDQFFHQKNNDFLNSISTENKKYKESGINETVSIIDPIEALDHEWRNESDSIDLLDNYFYTNEHIKSGDDFINENEINNQLNVTLQADSEYEMESSMRLKNILGLSKSNTGEHNVNPKEYQQESVDEIQTKESQLEESMMKELELDLLEKEIANESVSSPSSSDHLVTGPILKGLAVNVGDKNNIEQMHLLSEELGATLRKSIQGILEIHQHVEGSRFGVINRNLQPIEDNPLRLNLTYQETMSTLFDNQKSVVHLSAPAAVEESLRNIKNHNEAMQYATSEALVYIVKAFSPDTLMKRFNHYKRSHESTQLTQDSWAWSMYKSYFEELTSSRQHGFEKLFWEIFEQSYDKKIREMQLES